jgi:transcriptional regulator with XRE-family HTH domain
LKTHLMPLPDELEPLLTASAEALDVEIKGWLDLARNIEHQGLLAKAAIALANHGGGYIVIGLREEPPELISEPCPSEFAAYNQDLINQIISRFSATPFHCTLKTRTHQTTGFQHPVIQVRGGFGFPVMSKRGTPENSIKAPLCYMRKPGPASGPPETQAEWEILLSKCLRNRREDMLDAIRTIVEGKPVTVTAGPTEEDRRAILAAQKVRQIAFADGARSAWVSLTANLDPQAPARCPLGRYEFDYSIDGEFTIPGLRELLALLRRAVVRYTGWPAFWIPDKPDLEPYPMDDSLECWLGKPGVNRFEDPSHSDFWRASPEGRMFLLRGYAEDSSDGFRQRNPDPGMTFDIAIPTWRVAECLLHASNLASLLVPNVDVRIAFRARWFGLRGRRLISMDEHRVMFGNDVSQQDEYACETAVNVSMIADNLPEIVYSLLAPLYERFSLFQLPQSLPAEEILKMKRRTL